MQVKQTEDAVNILKKILHRRDKTMQKNTNGGNKQGGTQQRGFSLPTTTSKPSMPQVKPPKNGSNKK